VSRTRDSDIDVFRLASHGEPAIPVLRPQLPDAERLLPYLRRIDSARIYSNWGPLAGELERRLAERLGVPTDGFSSASSGTAALVGAILASAGRATLDRPLALIPAFTFIATAAAVQLCGYDPYLLDVDADSWMLDPGRVAGHPNLEQVGLVVPVAPFGRPVPQAGWTAFRDSTGVPVVIDGAASFDRLVDGGQDQLGEIPVTLSFHATKCFATGEGGGVASTDTGLVVRAAQALNFGFHMTRDSRLPSTNGKLSEYHAAVGLAEDDGWEKKHGAVRAVAGSYRRRLAEVGLAGRLMVTPEVGASYALFSCGDAAEAERIMTGLTSSGVDTRRWYGEGLHRHTHLSRVTRDDVWTTERLAHTLIGLPLAPDLDEEDVAYVAQALARSSR
jgi:dTDP-4-amino-4,6-dideoxygalactose transaminase